MGGNITPPSYYSIEIENMREGDISERLLKIGSIPLFMPTPTEIQVRVGDEEKEGKEVPKRNLYLLGLKLKRCMLRGAKMKEI